MKEKIIVYWFFAIFILMVIVTYIYIFIPNYQECREELPARRCIHYLIR